MRTGTRPWTGNPRRGTPGVYVAPPPADGFAYLNAQRHTLACREYGDIIANYEHALDSRWASPIIRLEALVDAAEICHECPLTAACGRAARKEHYTGIAGGQAWKAGMAVRRP